MDKLDIKDIWKAAGEKEDLIQEHKIASLLDKKPMSIIERLKRLVIIEIITNGLLALVLTPILIIQEKWWWVSGLLLVISFSIFNLVKLLSSIKRADHGSHVLTHVKNVYKHLTKLLLYYKLTIWLIAPFGFFLGMKVAGTDFETLAAKPWLSLFTLLFMCLTVLFSYKLTDRLYGRKARQLKEIMKDKDEDQ